MVGRKDFLKQDRHVRARQDVVLFDGRIEVDEEAWKVTWHCPFQNVDGERATR